MDMMLLVYLNVITIKLNFTQDEARIEKNPFDVKIFINQISISRN